MMLNRAIHFTGREPNSKIFIYFEVEISITKLSKLRTFLNLYHNVWKHVCNRFLQSETRGQYAYFFRKIVDVLGKEKRVR